MDNVSVEGLLVAQDVGQHRPRDHIHRPVIFGRDVENAVDDAVHELLVDREARPELWEKGQEVVPVGRGEVRLESQYSSCDDSSISTWTCREGGWYTSWCTRRRRGDSHRMSE